MSIEWQTKYHDTTSHYFTQRFDNPQEAILSLVGDDIGMAIKRGEEIDSPGSFTKNEELVGAYTWNDFRIILFANSVDGVVLTEVLGKTLLDKIDEKMLITLKNETDINKRHNLFRKLISRTFKSGKEKLVRFRSARREKPNANEEMGELEFMLLLIDPDDYIHWASIGQVNLMGIDQKLNNINLSSTDPFSNKSRIRNIDYGYFENEWSYLLVGNENIVENVEIDKYLETFSSTIDLEDKVKLLMNDAVQNNLKTNISYAILKTARG